MKIYKLRFDVDNYENLEPLEDISIETFQMFDGTSHIESWNKMRVKKMNSEKEMRMGDAPGFIIPVFSKKATDILMPLIKNDVELLPIECEGIEMSGINVLSVINAVDYEKSEYKTFRDGKRILAFQKYCFKPEIVGKRNIFKIPDEKRREAFVSEKFYNAVLENGLEGFKIELVWEG